MTPPVEPPCDARRASRGGEAGVSLCVVCNKCAVGIESAPRHSGHLHVTVGDSTRFTSPWAWLFISKLGVREEFEFCFYFLTVAKKKKSKAFPAFLGEVL